MSQNELDDDFDQHHNNFDYSRPTKIEEFYLYVSSQDDIIITKENAAQLFLSRSRSQYNILKIAAYSQIQNFLKFTELTIFQNQLYGQLLATACTISNSTIQTVQLKCPQVEQIVQKADNSIAVELTDLIRNKFVDDTVSDDEMVFILKQILVEQLPDIIQVYISSTINFDLSYFLIQYGLPLLLGAIRSSKCQCQVNKIFKILRLILCNAKDYLINANQVQNYYSLINVVATVFLIIPYLKNQIFVKNNILQDKNIILELFLFEITDRNHIFSEDVLKMINMFSLPIQEEYDIDVSSELALEYRSLLIQNEFQIVQHTSQWMQPLIMQTIIDFADLLSQKHIFIITTMLCRQIKERSIHPKFIQQILTLIRPKNETQTVRSHIPTLSLELAKLSSSITEYSLKYNNQIQDTVQQTDVLPLCYLLSHIKFDDEYSNLIEEVINILLTRNDENSRILMSYSIIPFVKHMQIQTIQRIISFFAENVQSQKNVMQHYLKSVGQLLIVICNIRTQQDIHQLMLNKDLKYLVDMQFRLMKGNFQLMELQCNIQHQYQFIQNVVNFNISSFSATMYLHFLYNTELTTQANIFLQYQTLLKTRYKYILQQQFILHSSLYADMLTKSDFKSALTHALEESVASSISHIMNLLESHEGFEIVSEKLHFILLSFFDQVNQNVELSKISPIIISCFGGKYNIFVSDFSIKQGSAATTIYQSPEKKKIKQKHRVIYCQDFQMRIDLATNICSLLLRLIQLDKSQEHVMHICLSSIDIIINLLFDPISEIRSIMFQQLGVMYGNLISENIMQLRGLELIKSILCPSRQRNQEQTECFQEIISIIKPNIEFKSGIIKLLEQIYQTTTNDPNTYCFVLWQELIDDKRVEIREHALNTILKLLLEKNKFVQQLAHVIQFQYSVTDSETQMHEAVKIQCKNMSSEKE